MTDLVDAASNIDSEAGGVHVSPVFCKYERAEGERADEGVPYQRRIAGREGCPARLAKHGSGSSESRENRREGGSDALPSGTSE